MSRYLKVAMSAACVALATFTASASASAAVFPARHLAMHMPARHVAAHRHTAHRNAARRQAVARCTASKLSGVLRFRPELKTREARALLVLTDKSKQACSLRGYASFGFLGGDGKLISASRTAYLRTPRPRWFLVKPRGHAYANVAWKLCGSGGANGSGGEWTGGGVFTAPLDTRQVSLDEANYKQAYGRVCSFNFVATALRVHQA